MDNHQAISETKRHEQAEEETWALVNIRQVVTDWAHLGSRVDLRSRENRP